MTAATDVPQLYRPTAIDLWVEDAFTRTYLKELWDDPRISFHVAGDAAGVAVMARQAEKEQFPAVYGVIDRDFGPTNRDRWFNPGPTSRLFRLPAHEVENYLLDPNALHHAGTVAAGDGFKLDPAGIDGVLKERADELAWWAACGAVMADLSRLITAGFPGEPPKPPPAAAAPVSDRNHARDHICDSDWFRDLGTRADPFDEPDEIEARLDQKHDEYAAALSSDEWRQSLPGKELLKHVIGRVWPVPAVTAAVRAADLAQTVASWQQLNAAPTALTDLHQAIRERFDAELGAANSASP